MLPPPDSEQETRLKLYWLICLRWITAGVQSICILLAFQLNLILAETLPLLTGLTLALIVTNLLAIRQTRREQEIHNPGTRLLFWMLIDWLLFMLALSLVSDIHNPLFPLSYLYLALAAVLLPGSGSLLFLGIAIISVYLLHPVQYLIGTGGYIRLSGLIASGIQALIMSLIWGFIRWISLRLEHFRTQVQQLQQRQEQLQRLELLGALGAGVAHEFATPLNTLRMRLERIKRQSEHVSPDLEAALNAQQQCETRLKTLASLPTTESLTQQSDQPLQKLVAHRIDHWLKHHPDCPVTFVCTLPPRGTLKLPDLALNQAIDNLLTNAWQAAPGQPIELHLYSNANRICLEIRDQGPGWPELVQQHLGEPFISTRERGTGLGLYSVFLLARALGGELKLEANTPQGACAKLFLPVS